MLVLPVLFLLRALFHCPPAEAQTPVREMMKKAALQFPGPLTCDKWDCDCAFDRQRSCCCGAKDMFDIEDTTFERIRKLWWDVSTLKYTVLELTESYKISFKATMDPSISSLVPGTGNMCFGPFNANVPIPYTIVSLNHGHGYNPTLGVFTAPRSGVYLFSYAVYSTVARGQRLYHKIQMMMNGHVVVSTWEHNREDYEDSATQVAILPLNAGDQVYMELTSGREICNFMKYNVFTGYMLYPSSDESDMYI